MENASQALIIAAGMIIVLLVISLVLYAWTNYTEYYSTLQDIADIEDLAEFNEQFTNYERDDVLGYDIISLANQVADYNTRYSTAGYQAGTGSNTYSPIELVVILDEEGSNENRLELTLNGKIWLFEEESYTQNSTINELAKVITTALGITDIVGTESAAANIAKSMSSIILSNSQLEYNKNYLGMSYEESYRSALATFNSLTDGDPYDDYEDMVDAVEGDEEIEKYYEYYQFKKGIFKCDSITYNDDTNRVDTITFEFTGKIE